ncbi:hypothetical protein PM082_018230 [Marasmius tenuissimus]|nr:hypothetical protein PM082_018230 [Marasmius tenuissimus]
MSTDDTTTLSSDDSIEVNFSEDSISNTKLCSPTGEVLYEIATSEGEKGATAIRNVRKNIEEGVITKGSCIINGKEYASNKWNHDLERNTNIIFEFRSGDYGPTYTWTYNPAGKVTWLKNSENAIATFHCEQPQSLTIHPVPLEALQGRPPMEEIISTLVYFERERPYLRHKHRRMKLFSRKIRKVGCKAGEILLVKVPTIVFAPLIACAGGSFVGVWILGTLWGCWPEVDWN